MQHTVPIPSPQDNAPIVNPEQRPVATHLPPASAQLTLAPVRVAVDVAVLVVAVPVAVPVRLADTQHWVPISQEKALVLIPDSQEPLPVATQVPPTSPQVRPVRVCVAVAVDVSVLVRGEVPVPVAVAVSVLEAVMQHRVPCPRSQE
jgi:hypothetical protein